MVSDNEDIEQSLAVLFTTSLGERLLHPTYGCDLRRYLFEPMNVSTTTLIQDLVSTAILYFEPRIRPDAVTLSEVAEDGILRIQVDYTVRTTNSRYNFVFPFYLHETGGGTP